MVDENDGMTTIEARVLAVKIDALKQDVGEMRSSVGAMARSMEALVRLEEQQRDMRGAVQRAFDELKAESGKREELAREITNIKSELPGYRELRRWVIGGVLAGVGMMAAALISLLIVDPMKRGYQLPPPHVDKQVLASPFLI